jgi:hypothetical protein
VIKQSEEPSHNSSKFVLDSRGLYLPVEKISRPFRSAADHFPTSSNKLAIKFHNLILVAKFSIRHYSNPPSGSTFNMSVAKTLQQVKQFIPPLSSEMHKGQAGRVGVIGGSEKYRSKMFKS